MRYLKVNDRLGIPESELRWRFSRSGGPGGQHVNTSDSRAELSFDLLSSPTVPEFWKERAIGRLGERIVDGVVIVAASDSRSQWRNRALAEQRLVDLLQEAFAAPKPARRPTRPTRSSQRERLDSKRRRSETKQGRRFTGRDD